MKKYRVQYLWIAICLLPAIWGGCDDEDIKRNDLSLPVIVDRFYPTSGGMGTEILITGRNFSEDTTQISVTLDNKRLKVLGSDRNNILVVVPPRLGSGHLEVSIAGRESVSTLEKFSYLFSASVTTLAGGGEAGYMDGSGSEARFYFNDSHNSYQEVDQGWRRGCVCADEQGNVYVGDAVNSCIRKITPDGTVTTLAGRAGDYSYLDGQGNMARFRNIYDFDFDAGGNLIITDVDGWCIRQMTPENVVTTLGSTDFAPWYVAVDKRDGSIYVSNKDGGLYRWSPGGSERISGDKIAGIAVDKEGNIYAAACDEHLIVRYAAGTWERTTVAGSTQGYADGSLLEAQFSNPIDVALDASGDIYVAGNGSWDGGANADQSIRRIDMASKVVRTVAGNAVAGYVDANGASAAFSGPQNLTIDWNGVIYVYDKQNNAVRKIVYE